MWSLVGVVWVCGWSSAWKWGRYGNCNWWSSHPSRRFRSKGQQRIDLTHQSLNCSLSPCDPCRSSQDPWAPSGVLVWLWLLWWCSTQDVTVRRLNSRHTGASRIYLGPAVVSDIMRNNIWSNKTICHVSSNLSLFWLRLAHHCSCSLFLLETVGTSSPTTKTPKLKTDCWGLFWSGHKWGPEGPIWPTSINDLSEVIGRMKPRAGNQGWLGAF